MRIVSLHLVPVHEVGRKEALYNGELESSFLDILQIRFLNINFSTVVVKISQSIVSEVSVSGELEPFDFCDLCEEKLPHGA